MWIPGVLRVGLAERRSANWPQSMRADPAIRGVLRVGLAERRSANWLQSMRADIACFP